MKNLHFKKMILILIVLCLCILATFLFIRLLNTFCLFDAIENGDFDSACTLVERGTFINMRRYPVFLKNLITTNSTPLVSASKKGDFELVKLLVSNGADVNKPDNYTNQTPLLAALHGTKPNRFSLALYLIDAGANIHLTQSTSSAFYESLMVQETDSEDTIEQGFELFVYLVENKVNMSIYMSSENALTFAAHYRNPQATKYLVENNFFDVDEFDSAGDTALIVAARYGQINTVELLLDLGASIELTDAEGKNAHTNALENGYYEIAELLFSRDMNK